MRSILAVVALLALASPAWCGTFGTGSFESDYALDWAAGLTREADTTLVYETLRQARRQRHIGERLQAKAVVAAEVVAAMLGHPGDNIPPNLAAWLKRVGRRPTKSQAALAQQALERILDPNRSEVAAKWRVDISFGWRANVIDLMHRLKPGERQPARPVTDDVRSAGGR